MKSKELQEWCELNKDRYYVPEWLLKQWGISVDPGGGQLAKMKLKREPGADGKGIALKNVKYFGAQDNSGFELYRSMEHSADTQGHQFSYTDRNAFLISIHTQEGESAGTGGKHR